MIATNDNDGAGPGSATLHTKVFELKKVIDLAREKAKRAPRKPRNIRIAVNSLMAIAAAKRGERSSPFVSRGQIAKAKIIVDSAPEAIPFIGVYSSFEATYREAASRKKGTRGECRKAPARDQENG